MKVTVLEQRVAQEPPTQVQTQSQEVFDLQMQLDCDNEMREARTSSALDLFQNREMHAAQDDDPDIEELEDDYEELARQDRVNIFDDLTAF